MEKLDRVFKQLLSMKRKELVLRAKATGSVSVGPGVPDSPGALEGRRSQGSQNPRGADSAPAIPTRSKTGRKGAGPNAFPRRPPGNELFRAELGCGQRSSRELDQDKGLRTSGSTVAHILLLYHLSPSEPRQRLE